MLVNADPLDALASVMHRSLVERRGRAWVEKLKPMVDRQYFEVVIQAAVGRRVIARETVKPFRKDVTAKLYGGDHTRYDPFSGAFLTRLGERNCWKNKRLTYPIVSISDNRLGGKGCGELVVWISLKRHLWNFYLKVRVDETTDLHN